MGATLTWKESNGAGEVENTISNINFGSIDDYNIILANCWISRGTNSYSKYIKVLFTGSWTVISNMLFWKSLGTYKTDELIKAGANANYATPSQTSTGDATIPTIVGSALVIQSAEGDATIVYGASGVSGYTKYIRLQLQTSISTPSGAVYQKQFTFQYDEA
jgi:hypothetical protein